MSPHETNCLYLGTVCGKRKKVNELLDPLSHTFSTQYCCTSQRKVQPQQCRPSHKKPEIGLKLSSLIRARPKAHFLMLHFLILVPEKAFFLQVHDNFRARMMAIFIILIIV